MWTHVIAAKSVTADRHCIGVDYTRESDGFVVHEDYFSDTTDPAGWPGTVIDAKLKQLNSFDETALDAVTVGQPLDPKVVKVSK